MNLALSRCRGQCYNGAATMMGTRNGVAKQLSDEENRAVFLHCYGHALNLAVGDSVKCSKLLKDACLWERELCYLKYVQYLLVLPSTNAVSERSLSTMCRVETYLRSTMGQERLNNLLTLHVHKDYTVELDLIALANEFVSHLDRLSTFGKF